MFQDYNVCVGFECVIKPSVCFTIADYIIVSSPQFIENYIDIPTIDYLENKSDYSYSNHALSIICS